jgi:hypothetical protein
MYFNTLKMLLYKKIHMSSSFLFLQSKIDKIYAVVMIFNGI